MLEEYVEQDQTISYQREKNLIFVKLFHYTSLGSQWASG